MALLKINLDLEDENVSSEIFYLGISSQFNDIVLASRINHALEIELSLCNKIKETFKNGDQVDYSIFSTIVELENRYSPQYMLIQCNKNGYKLFNKITQLDYLLISNYPFDKNKKELKTIEELIYIFDLKEQILGSKAIKIKTTFIETIKNSFNNYFLDIDRNLFE